ncbi:MAG TPA: class I SAM-dependent methyltransferase, partial [Geobacteraceae bacterium]|nr:class I SAM-dependent methyltransferase [Geobacteraceae bacterium]
NVSNGFYRIWLDERMVYSCAYFTSPGDSLDMAQERKLDYICRKLRLNEGDRLLDIGCGWGGLVLHAARNYGVYAHGITLSRPQAELAAQRISAAGLTERCRVEVRDYRELAEEGCYDKIASVGMIEHVGQSRLPDYFAGAFRLLRPGGAFLNHGIAANAGYPLESEHSFISRYVFPDGELIPINRTLDAIETAGFELRDLESLREHYSLTLRHWLKRLEAAVAAAIAASDETTYRIWRLYMAGSAHGFDLGRMNVYQALLIKPDRGSSGLPLTRADWYA